MEVAKMEKKKASTDKLTYTLMSPNELLEFVEDDDYDPCEFTTEITEKDFAFLTRKENLNKKNEFYPREFVIKSAKNESTELEIQKKISSSAKRVNDTSHLNQNASEVRKKYKSGQSQPHSSKGHFSSGQSGSGQSSKGHPSKRHLSRGQLGKKHFIASQFSHSQYSQDQDAYSEKEVEVIEEGERRRSAKKKCVKVIKNPFYVDRLNMASNLPPPPLTPPQQFLPLVEVSCSKKRKCKHKKEKEKQKQREREKQEEKERKKEKEREKKKKKELLDTQFLRLGLEEELDKEEEEKRDDTYTKPRKKRDTKTADDDDETVVDFDIKVKDEFPDTDNEDIESNEKSGSTLGSEEEELKESDSKEKDGKDKDMGKRKSGQKSKTSNVKSYESSDDRDRDEDGKRKKHKSKGDKGKQGCRKKTAKPVCRKKVSDISLSLLPPQIPPLQRSLPLTSPKDIPEVEKQIWLASGQPEVERECVKRPPKKKPKKKK